ncbi:peptidoglycan editing factor PgeF [Synechococcus sp. PCC 7336]|uniref:peptidoglycan editing factor PgeF n=1 Tax=Synechococcus sp. PCC 7336 TaxID=195250 RepID=UPI00034733BC|nr:peptidoglycan editing factor PgeF [Synechococcus sp. PCC 7336]
MLNETDWTWHEADGCRWLTCRLLQDWPHAFSSCHSYPQKADALAPVQLGLPSDRAAWAVQVHGDRLLWTERDRDIGAEADALATETNGDSVWVRSADCVPILIAHPDRVCAIHSGWRGTAAQIAPKAIAAFLERGVAIADLKVALGPAISGSIYQVSREVADRVLQVLPHGDRSDSIPVGAGIPPVTYPDELPDKIRLDLRSAIALQLLTLGVLAEQISISPHCTYRDRHNFFSYRRLQDPPSPVQWSGIGLASS